MTKVEKVLGFSMIILIHMISGLVTSFILPSSLKRRARIQMTSRLSRWMLFVLRIRVCVDEGLVRATKKGAQLLVANHLSYLDIIALSSIQPSVFVTSQEVKNSFFVGWLSAFGGSLFVERRKRAEIPNEIEKISKALRDDFRVVLFPEATSTNGEKVFPFKRALLTSALRANAEVAPVCINYMSVNGSPIDSSNRDSVFYYGEMEFFSHLGRVFDLKSAEVHLKFLSPLPASSFNDSRSLADEAYKIIDSHYKPVRPAA